VCELPAEIRAEISDTTIAFLEYDIRQLWASADPVEDIATNSTDEDYQPIPRYRSPRPHDHEAGGSGSASSSDLAMVTILERLTQAQERHEVQM
jgi:hypothetical protein